MDNYDENGMPWSADIRSVEISQGVTSIGDYAFNGCEKLHEIIIPDSVTILGNRAFLYCTNLQTIDMPSNIVKIGDAAFESCTALKDVAIPTGVQNIGYNTFAGCISLEKIELPDTISDIGNCAFWHCTALKSIDLPESVTSIGEAAFQGCRNLENINLPESLSSINNSAFEGCSALKSVEISLNVKSVGENAFSSCEALQYVFIPDSVTEMGANVFNNCPLLVNAGPAGTDKTFNVEFGWQKQIPKNAFFGLAIKEVTIPEGITNIGEHAFARCLNLESVTIPSGVVSIETGIFSGCTSLKSVIIPDGVLSLVGGTFWECSALENVVIPGSIINIGTSTFHGCTSLKSINIPEGITNIGLQAFFECSSLKEITLPRSIKKIDEDAFAGCGQLQDVYYAGSENERDNIEFVASHIGKDELINAKWHYNFSDTSQYNLQLRYFTEWDAENQIAYFEDDLLHLGVEVTDETDTSFLDTVQDIVGHYVLVETKYRDDGMVGPNILISMEPVEAGTGTVQERAEDSLTVNDTVYPLALKGEDPVVGADKGDEVVYGVQDGKIVILVPLTTTTMRLDNWEPASRVLTVSNDLTKYTYKVSTLASEESLAFLNADRESDKSYNIEFSYDLSGKIAYRIYRVYEAAEGSEKPEDDESSQYIIDRVKEYTTEEFYAQYDEILNSNASNEVILQRLTELFDKYGFLDIMEGVHYLSNTQGNRYAYRTLLSDQMYCAWNYYDWLHNTEKGTAARAVMVVDGLIFNNEFSDWTDITNYVDDDYPAVKKYKDMLYDFMDAEALEVEAMSYISSVNQLSQKCTEAGKIYADSLIEKINACTSRDELKQLMQSADAQEIFREIKEESGGKITFSLSKESGFGKFAQNIGYAGSIISVVDSTVDNAIAIIELDSKLEVYSQYQSFLSEIQSATELPLGMRLAARSILQEMEEGEWHQINALASDIFGELLKVVGSETGFNITDDILKKVMGETGASSLSSYLAVINVSAFCINKIVDVGELIRGVQFVEGYVLLQNYYKEQLLESRDAFVDNPTAENAWAFFEDYNILYRLRYRGEKAYLAMSDIKGVIRIFTDFGYPVKAEVAETTMKLLEERCQFTIDEGVEVPESVSYFTKTVIDCPVNVEVYSPEGELVVTLRDGEESDISNEHGRFAVVYRPYTGEYAKVICLREDGDYRFRLVASGDGLVSFKMASKSDQNPVLYSFDHVAVSTDEVIETSVEQVLQENTYSIDADGNGDFEGTGEILTSVPSDNIPVQSISLDETDLNLAVGESVVLNYSILPTEATCQNVLWISSDPETVEISNGMATALKEGTAVVYCRSQDDLSLSAKCEIDVAAAHQHTMTLVSASTASCCSTGIKEHWHCTMCGKNFADSTGTIEMSDATIPVNAQNHTGGTEIRDAVKATSEAEGYTGDTYCLGCGARIASGTVIPKLTTDNPDAPAASEATTEPSITRPSQPSTTTVPEKEAASNAAKAEDEEKTQTQETELPNEDASEPSQTPQANGDESTIQKSDSAVQETEEQNQESGSGILVYVVLVLAAGCVIFGAVLYLWRRKKQ